MTNSTPERTASEGFHISDWYIDPSASVILRDDQQVHLEPKVMDLLVYLSQRPGQVHSRDELLEQIWDGVIVSDEALTNAIIKLRKAFQDDARNPKFIETLPKRGYRLIAPVRSDQVPENSEPGSESKTRLIQQQPLKTQTKGIGILLLILAVVFYFFNTSDKKHATNSTNEKPTIAVLPFINTGNEIEDAYFSDGIANDLITDLSKISGLIVISRNSSFTYKGKSPNVKKIAEELNVNYVLEGNVRKAGNQVRINVQLINTKDGTNLWADRYDGNLDDVFALQDKVTAKIVSTLAVQLTTNEQNLITQSETKSSDAYDSFLRGWELYQRQRPESLRQAISHFEKAVQQDPDYSRAYAALSLSYWQAWKKYWHTEIGFVTIHDVRFKAEEYLVKAMQQPTPLALQISTSMLAQKGNHDLAAAEGDRAIALDPNDPDGYVALAGAHNLAGNPQKALTLMEQAIRLNPHYPTTYLYELGLARFGIEEYDEAQIALQQAVTINPEDRWSLRLLIATLGQLGHIEEAMSIMDRAGENWRGFDPLSVRAIAFWYPFKNPSDAERLADGLRKAGVPD